MKRHLPEFVFITLRLTQSAIYEHLKQYYEKSPVLHDFSAWNRSKYSLDMP